MFFFLVFFFLVCSFVIAQWASYVKFKWVNSLVKFMYLNFWFIWSVWYSKVAISLLYIQNLCFLKKNMFWPTVKIILNKRNFLKLIIHMLNTRHWLYIGQDWIFVCEKIILKYTNTCNRISMYWSGVGL